MLKLFVKNQHITTAIFVLSAFNGMCLCSQKETDSDALCFAIQPGNFAKVQRILEENPQLAQVRNSSNSTPLHSAAIKGYLDVAQLLIKNGANVNARDTLDRTPLHFAASRGYASVVKLLLNKGAELIRMRIGGNYKKVSSVFLLIYGYR